MSAAMSDLRDAALAVIRPGEARPAAVLYSLHASIGIDRHHMVSAVWELVEDGFLTYRADGWVRRIR